MRKEEKMLFYWYIRVEWPDNLFRELFWRDIEDGPRMPHDYLASLEYVLLTALTEREMLAVRCRYQYRETFSEIGDKLGVRHERARQIVAKSICKLRHPSNARFLKYGIKEYLYQYGDECREVAFEEGYQKGIKNATPKGTERAPVLNPYGAHLRVPISSLERINIEELDLSVRAYNGLKRANLNTVGDVLTKSKKDILRIKNIGKGSIRELEEKLKQFDVQLKEE